MLFCNCQGLKGLEVKSANNNNNNNKLSTLNRCFNIDCASFEARWRWCVLDPFPRKGQTADT
jgi:hypothetical protein